MKNEWKVNNLKIIFDNECLDFIVDEIIDYVQLNANNNDFYSEPGKSVGSYNNKRYYCQHMCNNNKNSKLELFRSSVKVPKIINNSAGSEHYYDNVSAISINSSRNNNKDANNTISTSTASHMRMTMQERNRTTYCTCLS